MNAAAAAAAAAVKQNNNSNNSSNNNNNYNNSNNNINNNNNNSNSNKDNSNNNDRNIFNDDKNNSDLHKIDKDIIYIDSDNNFGNNSSHSEKNNSTDNDKYKEQKKDLNLNHITRSESSGCVKSLDKEKVKEKGIRARFDMLSRNIPLFRNKGKKIDSIPTESPESSARLTRDPLSDVAKGKEKETEKMKESGVNDRSNREREAETAKHTDMSKVGKYTDSQTSHDESVDPQSTSSQKKEKNTMAILEKREKERLLDKSWVLIPVLLLSEPCRRCGEVYDAEDNDSNSCVFHADKDGKIGQYRMHSIWRRNSHPGNNDNNDINNKNNTNNSNNNNNNNNYNNGYNNSYNNYSKYAHVCTSPRDQLTSVRMWSCCQNTDEYSSGCFSRPHICKDVMVSVRAHAAPSVRIENIDMTVISTLEISIFPGAITSWLQVSHFTSF